MTPEERTRSEIGRRHTVALVEDNRTTAESLRISIRECRNLKLTAIYSSAEAALQGLPKVKPDVVLLDINLPRMNGIQCLQTLRSMSPGFAPRVLMLTAHSDSRRIFEALRAGADGYLLKRQTSGKELHAAIRNVVRGGAPLSPRVAKRVIDSFRVPRSGPAPARSHAPETFAQLSAREVEVLELLTRGLMYKQIADSLRVSIHAIRKHLQSIYRKLRVRSRSEAMLCWLHRGGRIGVTE